VRADWPGGIRNLLHDRQVRRETFRWMRSRRRTHGTDLERLRLPEPPFPLKICPPAPGAR
jgi:hypothetical protein